MTTPENILEAVSNAMSETFEGMIFMQTMLQDEEAETESNPDQLWSKVDVTAPGMGVLVMACSQNLAGEIVESLFGPSDDAYSDEMMLDALSEIVNTIVGRCMAALIPEGRAFELGLPQTGRGWPDIEGLAAHVYATDLGEQILVGIDLLEVENNAG